MLYILKFLTLPLRCFVLFLMLPGQVFFAQGQSKIDPKLESLSGNEMRPVFIMLSSKPDLTHVQFIKGKEVKTARVYHDLLHHARISQNNISGFLDSLGLIYRPFYIVNGISLHANSELIKSLSLFPEVKIIMEDGNFMMADYQQEKDNSRSVEWGLTKIKAPLVWSQGFKGQNVVIGGQDTGYKWDHVQLINKYRGWNGSVAQHDYNWHDAIYANNPMTPAGNPCGYNLAAPCDDNNHGTHTMGTMVGNHLADTIGVAPDAKWIGCRNMEQGYGTLTSYVECFEWFLAPYAYGDGPEDGDPSKMPHVINNSWGCPTIEGCNTLNFPIMEEALMNLRTAGCVIVVSNGNSGSACSTTYDPPAFFEGSFSVGATNSSNAIASFSSRGPVTYDSSNRLKPNVSAPGVSIRSSIVYGGTYGTYQGTSMAGPHVAGAVALIISANPDLAGEVDQIEDILERTTLPLYSGTCGSLPSTATPNNAFGYGLIDVERAVALARDTLHVPIIKTDQFGYRPGDKKIAILSNPITGFNQNDQFTPAATISLKNATTHQVVYSGLPVSWNSGATHSQSGDKVWHFDFTSYTTSGKYYVASGATRSEDFIIHDTVYHHVFKEAFKPFYMQRCGTAKLQAHVHPGYADGSCHSLDLNCKFYANFTRTKNLSGGWHDAGDYNKYVNFAYPAVFDLLFSFHLHPAAWVSDNMDIPESGNGIPDLLDEVKYETDWLLKMQEPNGSVLSIVGVANNATASPPSADGADRLYGPATTSASFSTAAMLAFAATQFKKINQTIALQYATTLQTAAVNAYDWAVNNPGVTFMNSGIIGAGEQELDSYETSMRRLCSAIFLYELTGNTVYKTHVESQYTQSHMKLWNFVYPFENPTQLSLLYYAHLAGATQAVSQDIINTYKTSIETSADNLPAHTGQLDAYRAYLTDNNHTWGSNRTKCNMGNLYSAYHDYGLNLANNNLMNEISTDYLSYLHGRNPVGRSFLTNMEHAGASKSINSIYHNWFTHGSNLWDDVRKSVYGPAPGFVSGGVNPSYSLDNCCTNNTCGSLNYLCDTLQPPMLQPIQKAYLDWNTGWPQNSWEVTEPAIYYQSSYLFLLSGKVNLTGELPAIFKPVKQLAGEMYIEPTPNGILLKSSNGSNYRVSVNNSGQIGTSLDTNPITSSANLLTGNYQVSESQKGIILQSPNSSLWRIRVNTQGVLYAESVAVLPNIRTQVTGKDLYIVQPDQGFIVKDRDAFCYQVFVNNAGQLFTSSVSCN